MSVLTSMRVADDGSRLVARCVPCGQELLSLDGFDRDVALGTLFQHHPPSAEALHRPELPAGWRTA